jgi:hypothetical protein
VPNESRRRHPASAVAVVALLFAACSGDRPRPPTSPAPPAPAPGSPAPTVVRIEITAPAEIEPNAPVQLSARAVKSDGTVEDVSGQAKWTSSSAVVLINTTGAALGLSPGEAIITAEFSSHTATAGILVLRRGTFALRGVIRNAGSVVANATVAVLSGTARGMTVRSRDDGSYVLYGVAGPTELHVKKDGYLNELRNIDVKAHLEQDFDLVADATAPSPVPSEVQLYTLTITASGPEPDCSLIPAAAKRRVYTAALHQNGENVRVFLSGGDFRSNTFAGVIRTTGGVTFTILPWSFWDYEGHADIHERLDDGYEIWIFGQVSGQATPGRISARGGFITKAGFNDPGWCDIDAFEMVRR